MKQLLSLWLAPGTNSAREIIIEMDSNGKVTVNTQSLKASIVVKQQIVALRRQVNKLR
ncbi:hypothetical protein [Pseudoalteromonas maricaloris]|uniref:hypothetical protein n=1 Tax=Pseudoalteromonas maricaloris TaxID=184924 RepID=UPI0012FDD71A|nr:hypothetical protein [Pseudoalteromonas flavipulchra]